MDDIDPFFLGDANDARDVEIGGHRAQAMPDQVTLVCLVTVNTKAVLFGIDSDGAQPQLSAGAKYADRDFAAIRCH